MRRPPSYSDSFLVLPDTPAAVVRGREQRAQTMPASSAECKSNVHHPKGVNISLERRRDNGNVVSYYPPPVEGGNNTSALDVLELTPIRRPADSDDEAEKVELRQPEVPSPSRLERCAVFAFQGSLHILFISAFETAFYFLYVNRSENAGILGAINTYYQPLTADCQGRWSNTTKAVVEALLSQELNVSAIDAAGAASADSRAAYNHQLLIWSSMYSVIAAGLCGGIAGFVRCKGWSVAWRRVILENILFVVVLGLYEAFFFRTVIYNYETLSTPELSRYIVDGLAACASS